MFEFQVWCNNFVAFFLSDHHDEVKEAVEEKKQAAIPDAAVEKPTELFVRDIADLERKKLDSVLLCIILVLWLGMDAGANIMSTSLRNSWERSLAF